MKVWHLFKQSDAEDPRRSPFLNKKLISEVYLPRMLSTKVGRKERRTRERSKDVGRRGQRAVLEDLK